MNQFNYTEYNRTTSIGLENNCPNSYTNPILQFLYEIPGKFINILYNIIFILLIFIIFFCIVILELTLMALNSQTSKYHHTTPTTLWCELGFLYHMMHGIQKNHIKKQDQNYTHNVR
jgi:hypothetical protein